MGAIDRLYSRAIGNPTLRVFTIAVRVLLALGFAPSGFVKIMAEPFTTLPVSDPVGYFFAGFFSPRGYYQFVGVAQWLAAGLLLFPRTATIGALLYLPIIVNIFAITLAVGPAFAGTRFVTGIMLAANIYLLCWDWDRWKHIFSAALPARLRHGDLSTSLGMAVAAGIAFWGVMATHLARLRHESYLRPLVFTAVGVLLGLSMLVSAYQRASARR